MKKIFLILALVLPLISFSQIAGGSYVINSNNPAPYNTIYNAINHLNTVGITNSVTFLLDDNYTLPENITAPITINPLIINGSNANATLTIKPNVGKNLITLTASAPQYSGQIRHFFKIDRADNIIIDGSNNGTNSRNLVIKSAHQNNYNDNQINSSLIWVASSTTDSANNNTFKNITFEGFSTNSDNGTAVGIIFSNTNTITNSEGKGANNNAIINNEFVKFKTAIQVIGNSASQNTGLLINNNVFGSTEALKKLTRRGIRLSNTNNFTINNNVIDGIFVNVGNTENFSGILVENNSSNGVISKNIITNITKVNGSLTTGITLNSSNSNANIEVVNNMISKISSPGNNSKTTGSKGILVATGGNYKIYFNTVIANSIINSGAQAYTAALYISNNVTGLTVINNILINNQTGAYSFGLYSETNAAAFTALDYNNYFAPKLGSINNTNYNTLVAELGANSKNVNPSFESETNLKLQDVAANSTLKTGTPVAGITTDFEGDIRSTTLPTMGADEIFVEECSTTTIWNGTTWSAGFPTDSPRRKVILDASYNTADADKNGFVACELTINNANTILSIAADKIVEVTGNIVVANNSKIEVENNGSLVQINDDATYTGNSNSFSLKRTTTPISRYDFTYWSSPLKPESDFLVGRDQVATNRKGLSKNTLFDKYYKFDGASQSWIIIPYGTEIMVSAKGYIVRAPQEYAITNTPTATFTANFEGIPNNGVVSLNVGITGNPGNSNLIGNPYPSAIDVTKLYAENSNLIDGTFYLWSHNIAVSATPDANGVYQYNAASYLAVNQVGGLSNGSGTAKSNINIGAGQSFFVNSKAAGTVRFNNAMRVKEEGSNANFFKNGNTSKSTTENTIERNRIWLNITNTAGAYNETLIGYVTGATNTLEEAFDGVSYGSGTTLYSYTQNTELAIQGRGLPFEITDVVTLGYTAATAGEYSIGLESFDGLFTNQNVYLFDTTNNTYHNLKNGRFTFTSAIGTFNSRFEIRYADEETLGTDIPVVTESAIVVYNTNNQIGIKATNFVISTVTVYDITGKLLFNAKNIAANEFSTARLSASQQVVIVKIGLDNNQTVSKKVILK